MVPADISCRLLVARRHGGLPIRQKLCMRALACLPACLPGRANSAQEMRDSRLLCGVPARRHRGGSQAAGYAGRARGDGRFNRLPGTDGFPGSPVALQGSKRLLPLPCWKWANGIHVYTVHIYIQFLQSRLCTSSSP